MNGFEVPSWDGMFVPDLSLAESFLRASAVYLSLIVLFRVVLKRQTGSLGLPDVMLVVLVSEAASTSLSAQAKSIPNGLMAVFALLFWNYTLDRLAHRWPWLQRRLEPQPLELVRDGKPLRKNMDAEGISDDELAAQLRLNGIDDINRVKVARIESGGAVSVIPKDEPPTTAPVPPPPADDPAAVKPGDPPDIDRLTQQFLAAAADLRKAVAWHDEQAADHRAAAKAARRLLTSHGVRATAAAPTGARDDDPERSETAVSRPKTPERLPTPVENTA